MITHSQVKLVSRQGPALKSLVQNARLQQVEPQRLLDLPAACTLLARVRIADEGLFDPVSILLARSGGCHR